MAPHYFVLLALVANNLFLRYVIEKGSEVVFEDGDNRSVTHIKEEFYDVWQKRFSYYYRPAGPTTRSATQNTNRSAGGGMTGGGFYNSGYSWTSHSVVKPFEAFMNSKWAELMEGAPIREWLAGVRRIYRCLVLSDDLTT